MGAWLKQLWTDPAYFKQMVRGLCGGLGMLATSGVLQEFIPMGGALGKASWALGLVGVIAAFFIRSGDSNASLVKSLQALPPDEHDQVIGQLKTLLLKADPLPPPPSVEEKKAEGS